MPHPIHPWLRQQLQFAFLPGQLTPLLEQVAGQLFDTLEALGHIVQAQPDINTEVILTTARFGEQVPWRAAPLFYARRRFRMRHTPTVFALVHITSAEFNQTLSQLEHALAHEPVDEAAFRFAGLSAQAYHVLIEQGRRAGPILSLQRLVQAQAKSIRVMLVVGDDRPLRAFHFDLVGAYPSSDGAQTKTFYEDVALRIVTTVSTNDIGRHQPVGDMVTRTLWQQITTPREMLQAGMRFGERGFFTEGTRISDLVEVPAVGEAVAAQYSEGCYGTWEPRLNALVATVTGRARPVNKDAITEDDLAVIVGVRPDRQGALVRQVEGSRNLTASSEAVEMVDIDSVLPRIELPGPFEPVAPAPVVRSKVHGHRSIDGYDPRQVEYVPLAPAYQHYLVSCGTEAQAQGIREAFSHSVALQNPADPRQVVFTILPGHGTVIAEKWSAGKAPFQLIWEFMDGGQLQVGNRIPQGTITYIELEGRMVLDPSCLSAVKLM